jgi:hypothetical protein
VESLREASQVGERANESRGETLLHFTESSKGEDGRSKSSEEISRSSWAVGSHGGAGGYRSVQKGSKLRRGRAVDPESQGPSDLHVTSCIGDSRVEAPKDCNETCDIAIRDIPISSEPSISEDACQEIPRSRSSENRGFQR